MELLDAVPELPLLVAAVVFALACAAFRRAAATIVLVAVLLFVGSALLNWPSSPLATCYPALDAMILR